MAAPPGFGSDCDELSEAPVRTIGETMSTVRKLGVTGDGGPDHDARRLYEFDCTRTNVIYLVDECSTRRRRPARPR